MIHVPALTFRAHVATTRLCMRSDASIVALMFTCRRTAVYRRVVRLSRFVPTTCNASGVRATAERLKSIAEPTAAYAGAAGLCELTAPPVPALPIVPAAKPREARTSRACWRLRPRTSGTPVYASEDG